MQQLPGEQHERRVRPFVSKRPPERVQEGTGDGRGWRSGWGHRAPRGKLRVSVPEFVALRLLIPALPRFRKAYPRLELLLDLDDHVRDLVGDGLDAAVRCGKLTAGTPRPVLPGLMVERGAMWRVWPLARPTPPKVKVFGDFLAQLLAEVS